MKFLYHSLKIFLVFSLVVGLVPSFSLLNIALADTTSTLRPTADGGNDSASWANTGGTACNTVDCYIEVDELSGASCTNSDGDTSYIESSTNGANQTFDIDLSGISDDSTITQIDIYICHKKGESPQPNAFQTRRCVDGACISFGTDITAGGGYEEIMQSHTGLTITKIASTDIEIGVGITGSTNRKVRISKISAVITYTTSDTTSPSAVADLALSSPSNSAMTVSWTAPGDDGSSGTATSYDLRYSTSLITDANWSSATQVTGEPSPSVAGSAESKTVSGLSAETTYFFALKTSDEVPNESAISNVPSLATTATPDTTSPSDVIDLTLSGATASSIDLAWTAPGDDGSSGTATTYDIRYSTSAITDANWSSATQATGEPSPSAAGSSESITVSGLSAETTYYFALKTSDEVPNESGLSNVPSLATAASGGEPPPSEPAPPPDGGGGIPAAKVEFSGQAYPGSTIEVFLKSAPYESFNVVSPIETPSILDDGSFTIVISSILDAEYFFALQAEDADGTKTGLLTFDLKITSQDRQFLFENLFLPPTVRLANGLIKKGGDLEIVGYAAPNNVIEVEIDNIIAGEATSSDSGYYTFTKSTLGLLVGEHYVRVRQIDQNDRKSNLSFHKAFKISELKNPKADFNSDGLVTITDWSIFLFRWGSEDESVRLQVDMDDNGKIDISDFSIFLKAINI